jgi:hypothetical protein
MIPELSIVIHNQWYAGPRLGAHTLLLSLQCKTPPNSFGLEAYLHL